MKIGSLEIKNRIVRSATFEGFGKKNFVTNDYDRMYKDLAKGGTGLIIMGYACVQESGMNSEEQSGIYDDKFIDGLKKLSDIIHDNGEKCKTMMQLVHCGKQSFHLKEVVAPSAIKEPFTQKNPKEMTKDDILETIGAFSEGARRAKDAGYDGVQLHAAHGYLLSEFLSPATNKRTDDYGGNTDNRFRIIREIYDDIVKKVGSNFPVLIKFNADDFLPGGIDLEESVKIAKLISDTGFAAIEISSCMWATVGRSKEELGWKPVFIPEARTAIKTTEQEAYHLPYAVEIKKVIDVPLILVGGIKTGTVAERILTEKKADFISMSRPLIREPDLPNKWINESIDYKAKCISCNSCVMNLNNGGLRCIQEEKKTSK